MKRFATLFAQLDETTKTNQKVAAMVDYFQKTPAEDAAWAVYFLRGRRPKRLVRSRLLREWAAEIADVPEWLLAECHSTVGDSAETAALLLPRNETDRPTRSVGVPRNTNLSMLKQSKDRPLHEWMNNHILPLRLVDDQEKQQRIVEWWGKLDMPKRFVLNKLLTGAFRVGVSQALLTRALAEVGNIDKSIIAHRLMGDWQPTPAFFNQLLAEDDDGQLALSKPYPFYLAYPLETDITELGNIADWTAEWKWDGIRAQLIRRDGETFLWSRGEELITARYPEITTAAMQLPDGTVLDGEILGWKHDNVLSFTQLQRRIGRKAVGKNLLREVPVILLTYDLLELDGQDIRQLTQDERRRALEQIIAAADHSALHISELITVSDWSKLISLRDESRERLVEGLMLKHRNGVYEVGRKRGQWWKWKVDPYTIDAVMVYAQKGSGRRGGLFSDYTFAVWNDTRDELVPFAKAYSGLTDAEMRQVDAFVKSNTRERFGPMRSVTPKLVFELAFENIQQSTRHKSGIAVRFPRIVRWRRDKKPEDADSIGTILGMFPEPLDLDLPADKGLFDHLE